MQDHLLDVQDLQTHLYTREGLIKAVDGVSFYLRPGETMGLVGESGSGKTMTALSMMRLVPSPPGKIVGGKVMLDGEDLLALSHREMLRRRSTKLSMIFQDPMTSLDPTMKVGRQVAEPMELHLGLTREDATQRAVELLGRVGVPAPDRRIQDYPHQFSGGMRQRVMIAIALACQPSLLIADEPTTALDVTVQAQFLDLVQELQKEMGMAILWITHDLGVVAELCDRVTVMYAGRVVEFGPLEVVLSDPAHRYTAALLRSIPTMERRSGRRLEAIRGLPPDLSRVPSGCPFRPRCQYAGAVCEEVQPSLEQMAPEHYAACHFPRRNDQQ
ncbi:MAG: ABC transporter ATP-binding protein [Anaerolineae bacterium]|nr:ABC transporter ATP-binding protein [Anaerolineae bacterium]